ncbi:MAG: aldehyde reductase [Bacteroidota bacterium]
MSKKVLLTGITGFLGSHTAIALLNSGYQVLGTMRNLDRSESIREIISKHTRFTEQLTFAEANLTDVEVWKTLTQGVDFVQHIASPIPRVLPKNDQELIVPAKEGTLNVLRAAAENGVKRVVITSSTGSILYGKEKGKKDGLYSEKDWTDPTNGSDTTPYYRSKVFAERAAWDFMKQDTSGMELVTICPGAILGPILEKDFGTSANIVIKTMDGSTPALPKLGFDMVDVRNVADLHVLAMEKPEAAGERFIASAGYRTFKQVADTLHSHYPKHRIPKRELPNFAVRLFAMIDPTLKTILLDLGIQRRVDNNKAKKILKWNPGTPEEAILACAQTVVELGLAPSK